eukprot:CAMPEP_0197184418 /NCGR_PEP_ID=MMETSP1423-20130617/9839_1 /TAXON_ID=476441 /ORGANISM="Pseudo-nitzschia heimii, Strain UNC1101" /LENGTH=401 /DNA_ID=CAMNT_0042635223 /DNA_START=211 /DNA_END=1416 /DNA_ORIENTATION=+
MAGMIYDANQSLNWIIDDPNITEAFRNSSVVGSCVFNSSSLSMGARNTNKQLSVNEEKKDGESQVENNDFRRSGLGIANNASSTSLANLFSNEEERQLLGIGFFTILDAGFFISGYAGTGIVMSRNIINGEWSGPVAVRVSGFGAGLQIGASVRSVVYLIYDYFTLKSIIGTDGGVIFGLGADATIGTWSRDTGKQSAYITSPKMLRAAGIGSNVALCRGLAGIHGAISVKAGICKTRDKINASFYGKDSMTGADILLSGEPIEIPNSSRGDQNVLNTTSNYQAKRLMEMVHMKLKKLCLREDPQPFKSSTYTEDIQATLEDLYADESYDYDDHQMKLNSNHGDNKNGEDDIVLLEGDGSDGASKSPPLTKATSASTMKSKESDAEESEEEQPIPTAKLVE